MKLASFLLNGARRIGALTEEGVVAFNRGEIAEFEELLRAPALYDLPHLVDAGLSPVPCAAVTFLPPLACPGKIICVDFGPLQQPPSDSGPPLFYLRTGTSVVGHGHALVKPHWAERLDLQAGLALVISGGGRRLPVDQAKAVIFGYAAFNDVTLTGREEALPHCNCRKNIDATAALGPHVVTADEVLWGENGPRVETRVNGVIRSAGLANWRPDFLARLISRLSEFMTLEGGDVVVVGIPATHGHTDQEQRASSMGDLLEVRIEGIGTLVNHLVQEA